MGIGRILKYLGLGVGGLVALLGVAYVFGFVGVPQVESIDNQFGEVNNSTSEIQTTITVNNPNPIGISLGGTTIDYTVDMNNISMATGQKRGIAIGSGNSTVDLVTYLDNTKIPAWWYTHIQGGEQSDLFVDATVSHNTLGSRDFQTSKSIETNILGAFNSTETRPVNADSSLVSDPVLYINETSGSYGSELTREQTPIDLGFTVYNPKPYPYVVTRVDYTIYMNNITVGEGSNERNSAIPPSATETINANTVIQNDRLDEWWVSHLQNNQTTDLYVDMQVVVEADTPAGTTPAITIDTDALDYRDTIETDVFGNKENTGDGSDGNTTQADDGTVTNGDESVTATPSDDSSQTTTAEQSPTPTLTSTPTPTATAEDDDGGLLST
ncbi:LEA type 2 family protein [Salinibaculum salinum]|uniref:LEA type 2 family protein n=1 Tax=Salinibaculum salinum TaxID=3131996 RepID=UPI0030EE4263